MCRIGLGYCLRREKPSPARPRPTSASVVGSGIDSGYVTDGLQLQDTKTPAAIYAVAS